MPYIRPYIAAAVHAIVTRVGPTHRIPLSSIVFASIDVTEHAGTGLMF